MTKKNGTTKGKKNVLKTKNTKSKAIKKPKIKISTQVKGLRTTVIGSYPKPSYLKIPDWFKLGASTGKELVEYQAFMAK